MMRFRVLLPVAVLLPTLSAAQIAGVISYQGRLLRSSDATPISEIVDIGFALYAQQEGGQPLWSEKQTLGLSDGYFAALLGSATAFGASVWTGADRYLELTVGGNALAPRQRIGSAPYALLASNLVKGGVVDAASVSAGGASGAPLAARGSAPFDGKGLVTGTLGTTTLLGTGTAFLTEVAEGDSLAIGTETYQVTTVKDERSLEVTPALRANVAGGFKIQKPVCRFDSSSGSTGLFINAEGSVGIGTKVIPGPAASLEVAGNLRVRGRADVDGSDLRLGVNDGRPAGSIPHQRALVHTGDDTLVVNYGGDFEGGVHVDSALAVAGRLSTGKMGNTCSTVTGPCGAGTYGRFIEFLDRVSGDCGDGLYMRGFKFQRCGTIATDNEGLQLVMTCCR